MMAFNRRTFLQQAAVALPFSTTMLFLQNASAEMIADNDPVVLTLLHTNDLHGHVWLPDQPQGLVRLATFIQQIRAEMPNVILLDAGDMIHGTPEEKAFHGHAILDAMNALHYDVATAGNHEFDFGQKVLRDALHHARFPVLSANVVDTKSGQPWGDLKPWIVLPRGGIRIGIFGLTTPTTVQIEWPRTLEGITFSNPFAAAQKAITALREEQHVDMVIALSHLGFEEDNKLAGVPGIDVIIGAHSHTMLSEQVWINDVLIAQTGAYGRALGRIDLLVQPGKVISINGKGGKWWGKNEVPAPLDKPYPATPLWKPDANTAEETASREVYRPWRDKIHSVLDEVLTTVSEAMPAQAVTMEETPLGNLFADAIRAATKSDIAFMSSSQISPLGLSAGPLTVGNMYTVLGSYTRQHLVIARVPGSEMAHVLATVRSGINARHYPIHISGITVAGSGRIQVGDASLHKERLYTVASAAHVTQDYFYQKPGVEIISDAVDAITVRDAAIAYLRGHAPLWNELPNPPRWSHVIDKRTE